MKVGALGRIPNWAKNGVKEDVEKYGFGMAWHYFAYNAAWGEDMSEEDRQLMRTFDAYFKEHIQQQAESKSSEPIKLMEQPEPLELIDTRKQLFDKPIRQAIQEDKR